MNKLSAIKEAKAIYSDLVEQKIDRREYLNQIGQLAQVSKVEYAILLNQR